MVLTGGMSMEKVKVFVKDGCAKCPSAKEVGSLLLKEGIEVHYYDIDTADGLAEASFYGVLATPTMIVEDSEEKTLADYRGTVPTLQEVKEVLVK
jgi:glutaredoxin